MSGSSGAPVPVPNVVLDDDAESGNGPSLPMSPHSVEGAIGGPLYDDHHRSFRWEIVFYLSGNSDKINMTKVIDICSHM